MVNYEVNVYSHNSNEYLFIDNYFNTYSKAEKNYLELRKTLRKGEEITLYERELDKYGDEVDNKVILFDFL